MKITESSKYNRPEEEIRRALIEKMVVELGFPKGLISIERAISSRRYDVLVFSPEMKPLLLIECKAAAAKEKALHQALGYNQSVNAPFICLCGRDGPKTFWYENSQIKSVPFLPKFEELYAMARKL